MNFQDWGLIDYQSALEKQLQLVDEVHKTNSPGCIVFCSHPPVVTVGRKTKPSDLYAWNGPVVKVSRGGRATYHGPHQIVIYPIINLSLQNPARDITALLKKIEAAVIKTLSEYKLETEGKVLSQISVDDELLDETGVWYQSRKIASLGVAVKNWVSYHGAAINLIKDTLAFQGMKPCGFSSSTMISLEEVIGAVDPIEFRAKLKENFLKIFKGTP